MENHKRDDNNTVDGPTLTPPTDAELNLPSAHGNNDPNTLSDELGTMDADISNAPTDEDIGVYQNHNSSIIDGDTSSIELDIASQSTPDLTLPPDHEDIINYNENDLPTNTNELLDDWNPINIRELTNVEATLTTENESLDLDKEKTTASEDNVALQDKNSNSKDKDHESSNEDGAALQAENSSDKADIKIDKHLTPLELFISKKVNNKNNLTFKEAENLLNEYKREIQSNGNEYLSPFVKNDGSFFSVDELDPEAVLQGYGLSFQDAVNLSDHLVFSSLGNINGVDSFVCSLKTSPERPQNLYEKIRDSRTQNIKNIIGNSPTQINAIQSLLEKREGIEELEYIETGLPPFTGVGEAIFLDKQATQNRINQIASLRDKVDVIPIGEPVEYINYSSQKDKLYSVPLQLHKVVSKDPERLPQTVMESILTEDFSQKKDNKPIVGYQNNSQNFFQNQKAQQLKEHNERDETFESKEHGSKGKPQKTIAEVALGALSKLSLQQLAALLALAKLILKALLEMLKALTSSLSKKLNKAVPSFPVYNYEKGNLKKTLSWDPPRFSGAGPNLENKNLKDIEPNDVKTALEKNLTPSVLNHVNNKNEFNDPIRSVEIDEAKKQKVTNFNVDDLIKSHINDLTKSEKQDLLKNEENIDTELLEKSLNLPIEHKVSKDKAVNVLENIVLDENNKILFSKSYLVETSDGIKHGVHSAISEDGKTKYILVSENTDSNYDITISEPSDLTLVEYNGSSFVHKKEIDDLITNKLGAYNNESIKIIPLFDHENPSAVKPITLDEFYRISPILTSFENDNDLIQAKEDFNQIIEQKAKQVAGTLHSDMTDSLGAQIDQEVHPIFQGVLSINDKVTATIPNTNMEVVGSVIGAYEVDMELNYQIKTDSGVIVTQAENINLTGRDCANISDDDILKYINCADPKNKKSYKSNVLPQHLRNFNRIPITNRRIELLSLKDNSKYKMAQNVGEQTAYLYAYKGAGTEKLASSNKAIIEINDTNAKEEKSYLKLGGFKSNFGLFVELDKTFVGYSLKQPIVLRKLDITKFPEKQVKPENEINSTLLKTAEKLSSIYSISAVKANTKVDAYANKEFPQYLQKSETKFNFKAKLQTALKLEKYFHEKLMIKEDLNSNNKKIITFGSNATLSKTNFNFPQAYAKGLKVDNISLATKVTPLDINMGNNQKDIQVREKKKLNLMNLVPHVMHPHQYLLVKSNDNKTKLFEEEKSKKLSNIISLKSYIQTSYLKTPFNGKDEDLIEKPITKISNESSDNKKEAFDAIQMQLDQLPLDSTLRDTFDEFNTQIKDGLSQTKLSRKLANITVKIDTLINEIESHNDLSISPVGTLEMRLSGQLDKSQAIVDTVSLPHLSSQVKNIERELRDVEDDLLENIEGLTDQLPQVNFSRLLEVEKECIGNIKDILKKDLIECRDSILAHKDEVKLLVGLEEGKSIVDAIYSVKADIQDNIDMNQVISSFEETLDQLDVDSNLQKPSVDHDNSINHAPSM